MISGVIQQTSKASRKLNNCVAQFAWQIFLTRWWEVKSPHLTLRASITHWGKSKPHMHTRQVRLAPCAHCVHCAVLLCNRDSAWITSKCHSIFFFSPPPIYILLLGCTSVAPQQAAPRGQNWSFNDAIPQGRNHVWCFDICKGRLLSLSSADATFALHRAAWTTSASSCCASLEPPSCLQRHYTRRLSWRTCSNPK